MMLSSFKPPEFLYVERFRFFALSELYQFPFYRKFLSNLDQNQQNDFEKKYKAWIQNHQLKKRFKIFQKESDFVICYSRLNEKERIFFIFYPLQEGYGIFPLEIELEHRHDQAKMQTRLIDKLKRFKAWLPPEIRYNPELSRHSFFTQKPQLPTQYPLVIPAIQKKKKPVVSRKPQMVTDEAQIAAKNSQLPALVVGPAGSGKTLTLLSKASFYVKTECRVLYACLSPQLAREASRMYGRFAKTSKAPDFKSYSELESNFKIPYTLVTMKEKPIETQPFQVYVYPENQILKYSIPFGLNGLFISCQICAQNLGSRFSAILNNLKSNTRLQPEEEKSLSIFLSLQGYPVSTDQVFIRNPSSFENFQAFCLEKNLKKDTAQKWFEEFRGVLTGTKAGYLSLEAYQALGKRQSLLSQEEQPAFYDFCQKYWTWLREQKLYEPNELAALYYFRPQQTKIYDVILIDEAQDMTSIQLLAILKLLKGDQFMIAGDAHQIVGYNFFSWEAHLSALQEATQQQISRYQLTTNHRQHSPTIHLLSERLSSFWHKKFGVPDNQSRYLYEMPQISENYRIDIPFWKISNFPCSELIQEVKRDLTRYAIIVPFVKDKEALLKKPRWIEIQSVVFTLQEIKGLEFHTVFMWGFIDAYPVDFQKIMDLPSSHQMHSRSQNRQDDFYLLKKRLSGFYTGITRATHFLIVLEQTHFFWSNLGLSFTAHLNQPLGHYLKTDSCLSPEEQSLQILRLLESEDPGLCRRAFNMLDDLELRKTFFRYVVQNREAYGVYVQEQMKKYAPSFREKHVEVSALLTFLNRGSFLAKPFVLNVDVVQFLIAVKADLNQQDKDGLTALMYAFLNGNSEVVRLLIAAKADPNKQNKADVTALMLAALNGNSEVVQLLIAAKAGLNQQQKNGSTALMFAAEKANSEVVRLLIDAQADLNQQDKDGLTALMYSFLNGNSEVVRLLIAAQADLNQQDKNGGTALIIAFLNGNSEVVKVLIAAQADLNQQDKDGMTALMFAAEKGNSEVVKVLIAAQADLNKQDKDGQTALMFAAFKGNSEVVEVLIAAQADLNKQEKNDWTPLMVAALNGNSEVVKVLIDAKADLTLRNKIGETALDFAKKSKNKNIIQILKKHL